MKKPLPRTPHLRVLNLPEKWVFPTTRYRGSKRKILDWLWQNLKDLEFSTALDVFGGTGIVSVLFKRMGKTVTFNDYLSFNRMGGLAFVENSSTKLDESDVEFLLRKQKGFFYKKFISNTFKGVYYKEPENEWLDVVVQNVDRLSEEYEGEVLQYKQAIAFWAIGQACLVKRPFNLFHRSNLNLRTRRVDRIFGNKTSWEWPFELLFRRFVEEANASIFNNDKKNRVLQTDAFSLRQKQYDLVYFDPPYVFESQRDNSYPDIYHFLEGIVDYSKWSDYIDWNTKTLRYSNGFMEWPRTSREELLGLYGKLLTKFKESKIVFSYKSGGIVSVGDIETLLKTSGKKVKKSMRRYKYALSRKNGKPRENIEWLLIGV